MAEELTISRERLDALETVAREHERLKRLLEIAAQGHDIARYGGQGVLYVHPTTRQIIEVNPALIEMLGYTHEQLVGMPFDSLAIMNDVATQTRTYIETSIEERVYPGVFRHRLGHLVPAQVHTRLLYRGEAKVLYYRIEDQSLYHRLWHELHRREDDGFKFQQKLKMLNEITIELSRIDSFDALCLHIIQFGIERLGFDRLGIWFYDADKRLMLGSYGVDEQGKIRAEHDQRWSAAQTYIEEFIEGKTEASFAYDEAPIYNEKSEVIQLGWHISAPVLHAGRFIGVLTTDNLLRKQSMKSYEPELLRLYGITIGHLTELARSREQAFAVRLEQERTHMLWQFITNVGHDFRTPLSVINTKTFLVQRVDNPDDRRLHLNGIQEQVAYISRTLDDMLDFIALESEPTLNCAPTSLGVVLREIVEAQQALSEKRGVTCQLDLTHAVTIPIDVAHINRAVGEIVENALIYTPEGGSVYISVVPYPNEIGIRVRDTGIGIDPALHERIFEPLYRVNQARTERRSGLGLAIARAAVDAHCGRITLDSAPGEGSTFEVILPLT